MTTKKHILIPTLVLASAALLLGLGSQGARETFGLLFGSQVTLPATVHVGDSVSVPDYTFSDGTKATKTIQTPKGGFYSGDSFVVDSIGAYSVIYRSGSQTEVRKILSVRTANELFENNGKSSVSHGASTQDSTIVGTLMNFQNGGELTYQKNLTLAGASKNTPLVSFIVNPLSTGESALNDFTLTLTDVADSSNALTISFVDAGPINCDGQGCYVKAGATGQRIGGWEGKKFLTDAIYGCPAASSFRGLGEAKTLTLYYDDGEKALYLSQGWGAGKNTKTLVADFDSTLSYSTLWGGWTSGKVSATFSAGEVNASSASIVLVSLGEDSFLSEDYPDVTAPKITLDYAGETSIPSAVIGRDYPLFSATGEDDYEGEVSVKRQVYFHDSTSQKDVAMPTQINGAGQLYFTPTFVGDYFVRYSAKDLSANESVITLPLPCAQSKKSIRLSLPSLAEEGTVYSACSLTPLSEVTSTGGEGLIKLSRTLSDPLGHDVAVTGDSFVPDQIGVYTCRYVGTDYLGYKGLVEEKITIKNLDKVSFIGSISLPRALIKGFRYEVPSATAKAPDGVDKTKDVPVQVFYNDTLLSEASFLANQDTAKLTFKAVDGTETALKENTLPVVIGENAKNQAAYFVGDLSASEAKETLDLSTTQNGSSYFANPLNADDFALNLAFEENQENFSSISLSLVDSGNQANRVSFKLTRTLSGLTVSYPGLNEGTSFPMNGLSFGLNYHNATRTFSGYDGETIDIIKENDAGEAFSGFAGAVYLELSFSGVSGTSLIHLSKLNNQTLGFRASSIDKAKDSIAPVIYCDNTEAVKQTLGATITLLPARAYDVLSDVASFLVSVSAPDGSALFTNLDARSEKSFTLSSYGVYSVNYVAMDGAGNKKSYTRLYRVDEMEKPVLTLKTTLDSTYQAGAIVKLPEYTLTDNSASYHLDVFLELPDGQRWLLLNNVSGTETSYLSADNANLPSGFVNDAHSFKVSSLGKYRLEFFVYDDAFNYVNQSLNFTVSQ